jgi:hypothetical protein
MSLKPSFLLFFAQFESGEAGYLNVFTQFGDVVGDNLSDRLVVVLDEGLQEKANLCIVTLKFALDDPIQDMIWLAALSGLLAIGGTLLFQNILWDVLWGKVKGLRGCDLHRDVMCQVLELVGPGYEIGPSPVALVAFLAALVMPFWRNRAAAFS